MLFHEWLLMLERKAAEDVRLATCDNPDCRQKHLACVTEPVTRHVGRSTIQMLFCSKPCAGDYYVKQLRTYEGAS